MLLFYSCFDLATVWLLPVLLFAGKGCPGEGDKSDPVSPVSCIINPFDESFSRLNQKNEAVIDEITSLFRWLNLLLEHFWNYFGNLEKKRI